MARPLELYDTPATRSVAGFVGQANLWDGVMEAGDAVRVAFGLLKAEPQGFAPGSPVTVLVRPENVAAGAAGDGNGGENAFAGRIVRDRFLGAVRRYDMAVGDEIILGETGRRGPIASVSIKPEHVRLMPR